MKNRDPFADTKMPGEWIFKVVPVFIAFVFCLVIAIFIGFAYLGYKVVQEGPEGIGHEIGQVVKGFNEGRKQ